MLSIESSLIMRTTVDIDDPILQDVKRLQADRGQSLGRVVSDLLAQALAAQQGGSRVVPPLNWTARQMGARYDLADRDAVLDAMDEPSGEAPR
jgi:hypothetical protein